MMFVYLFEHGNPPALCLPVEPTIKWAEFKENIRQLYKLDPDGVKVTYFDEPLNTEDEKTLSGLGIAHKGLIKIKK